MVSRSESALLSSRIGKPAHVWRAHRVQGIINKSDGAEYREMASLRERDGRDVRRHLSGDSAEIAGDQETTIDPYFVQLINDNRPQTDPDATFGAEMRRITLDNDDANSSILGSRSHDAHIIAAATRALKR